MFHEPDGIGFRGMVATSIDGFTFQPSNHVFCDDAASAALQRFSGDGLPKFRGLPKEFGGSGEQVKV